MNSMFKTNEFSIQEQNTKKYWDNTDYTWTNDVNEIMRGTYREMAAEISKHMSGYDYARIVPSPVKVMTDKECLEWISEQNLVIYTPKSSIHNNWTIENDEIYGQGNSIYEAIHAARKNIER